MGTFIVRRLLISIPVFFGITVLVFVFVAIAPGDAASALIRPDQAADPADPPGDHRAVRVWINRSRSGTSDG